MLYFGPVSSALFDFATFGQLLLGLGAREQVFHTGWFIESPFTQVLVVLMIRTRARPFWQSRPRFRACCVGPAEVPADLEQTRARHDADRMRRDSAALHATISLSASKATTRPSTRRADPARVGRPGRDVPS